MQTSDSPRTEIPNRIRCLQAQYNHIMEWVRVGQLLQMDHTLVDVVVVDEVDREPIGRPWLTLALDVATRAVPGFHLSLDLFCFLNHLVQLLSRGP